MHQSDTNHIGTFMVAVGAVVVDSATQNILLLKRNDQFQFGKWEIPYGRLAQHEDLLDGLARELKEETGIVAAKPTKILRLWHIYRGEQSAQTEIFGTTFVVTVNSPSITLSDEHTAYQFVTPTQALTLITVPGIRQDIEEYLRLYQQPGTVITNLHSQSITLP